MRECEEKKSENEYEYDCSKERTAGEAIQGLGRGGEHESENERNKGGALIMSENGTFILSHGHSTD